ncbi:type II toxin-antitoxin system RelE family toxin [Commensalibacter communis]|uniref:type II toxin-antitoxin system RelE family toxin n=1 Tax=Commensalibacter communis TaxID=2972786 RepID=UPI0022FFAE0B|nr:type II toxin-antitoxin system RelE/ParE family toxin [Commensalibacter communis]CAI3960967.1 mRNA-degrading endonuclease RelE [Commensalibacter communis]
MAWKIEYSRSALSELKKLDKSETRRIVNYMSDRISCLDDPRSAGKSLTGNLNELWRYRVGNYRIVTEIQDQTICILVLRVGHRKDVYK